MTNSKFQIRNPKSRRRGFTLVELLVVVLIIAILATVVLFAMFGAAEAARAARTRSMIARVNDLILPIWESYRTRRVPMATANNAKLAAEQRLNGLHELMRMELPDRISDVVDDPVTINDRPSLSFAYQNQVKARAGGSIPGTWNGNNEGSECLYLILSRIQDGDTNGLEFIRETEIGDTDGDGMPEILDGWGKPIAFLRWAPGFIPSNGAVTAIQDGAKPDPFDPLQTRTGTYYLFPLIFSAGPDRAFDIAAPAVQYSGTSPPNDPFADVTVGSPADNNDSDGDGDPTTGASEHIDNIHNHLISTGIN